MCVGGAGNLCHPTPAPLPPALRAAYRVTDPIADTLHDLNNVMVGPDGEPIPYYGGTVFTPGIGSARSAATFVQVFRSHSALVRALGPAGPGRHWHHIVEQTPGNVARFGAQAIHNTQNVVALEIGVHQQVSAFYSSIRPQFTGSSTLTVREWLSTQPLSNQRQFGEQVLRLFGAP
jgi:hypothetical protein